MRSMPASPGRPRVAVLSPFIDKRHGTERCVAEQVERLADAYEIHLYSNQIRDIDLDRIIWHRVPIPPGPHLFRYVFWLTANRICRWRDGKLRGLKPDVTYSAGVNCLDADVVSVHVLFSKVRGHAGYGLRLSHNPVKLWPRIIHRRLYYRLAEYVEKRLYKREGISLVAVSQKGASDLRERFGSGVEISVAYNAADSVRFTPAARLKLRSSARASLRLMDDTFAVLLIGNDWRNKGLPCLLEAVSKLPDSRLRLLIVGEDTPAAFLEMQQRLGMTGRVEYLPPRADVEFYYAAADVYTGPSLEDSFSLPPLEAMSSGLPVIVSRASGVSEIIHHGEDGLILEGTSDSGKLSEWLIRLASDEAWRRQLGEAAVNTAKKYTWEQNARQMQEQLEMIIQRRTNE